jgi:ubiquinone/menaquinone biosynthesis C-methylase UbiE
MVKVKGDESLQVGKYKSEKELVKQYNKIWAKFAKDDKYRDDIIRHKKNRKKYHEIVSRYINEEEFPHIIEIGCGTSIDTNLIAEQNKSGKYFAIDISKNSISNILKINQYFHSHIHFLVGDTFNLPFKENSFNLAFSQGLIEHFKNPITVIKEHMRVLKTGGFLIINVPQKFTGYTLMKKNQMRKGEWELGWEMEFSYNDLKKIGKHLELKEIEVFGYQYWKSWKEPMFVLKDLIDKAFRKLPLNNIKLLESVRAIYNAIWRKLEKKWGHYFLQNIVIVFTK